MLVRYSGKFVSVLWGRLTRRSFGGGCVLVRVYYSCSERHGERGLRSSQKVHPSGVWPRDAGEKMTMEAFLVDGGNDGTTTRKKLVNGAPILAINGAL